MRSRTVLRLMVGFYIFAFFAYLFGPLVLMSLTAFNSSPFPRVSPWECFTFEWFGKLVADERLMEGFRNSLIIGAGVVALSVPIGLAGAMMLTQLRRAVRSFYYTVVISPILVPGVVLGISTLIFWDRLGTLFGADYDTFFYNGMFLTVIGQATFISAYTMLVFISRLQRFDPALEEAALDLGATHVQAFRKILLPFLRPAIGSAAVLAFLASFENYNTTVFTIVSESTLTTVLASKVRYGIDPSISALAVLIVAVTLVGAVVYEILRRREEAVAEALASGEGLETAGNIIQKIGNPAAILIAIIFVAGLATVWTAKTYDVAACKARIAKEKEIERKIREAPGMFVPKTTAPAAPTAPAPKKPVEAPGTEQYKGIFAPENLEKQVGPSGGVEPPKSPGAEQYKSIFDPGNLKQQVGPSGGVEPPKSPGAEQYKSIFDPSNLKQQVGPSD